MGYQALESMMSHRFRPQHYVIVNGFWRSGTTWVQEVIADALQARCVYEPLEARNRPAREYAESLASPRHDAAFINALFPFADRSLDDAPRLRMLLKRALAGGWYDIWAPLQPAPSERTLAETLRTMIVTKFVRGALCLGAMQHTFGIPVIHVYRDPRAIVASLLHPDPNWGGGTFQNFPLGAHLLDIGDGRDTYFSRWRTEINEIDRMSNIARLTAYHCLTERFVAETLSVGTGKGLSIGYETLVRRGFAPVYGLLRDHGLEVDDRRTDVQRPSHSDKRYAASSRKPDVAERLSGWRGVLKIDEIETIDTIANQFGMTDRCIT